MSVGIVHYSALFPCLLASLVTTGVTRLLGVHPEGYVLMGGPALDWQFMLRTGLLAVACALLSMAF